METYDISAVQADYDADTLAITTAIDAVKTCDVIVIGEDADILVLLLHYYNLDLPFKIFFTSDKNTKEKRIWDIREVKTKLPKELVNCILPIHAFLGCDTVSRINSIGKGLESFKKIIANEEYTSNFRKFLEDDVNKDDITLRGENLVCLFYSGRADDQSLNKLRFVTFCKKGSTSYNAISPDSLLPTSNAAMYHSLRVYHQVQTWLLNDLLPLKWGYMYQNKRLMPVLMDIPPAPPELLKMF